MIKTALRLGRVSNLPTVWTNALAGAVLAGASAPGPVLLTALVLTLFYIGGMWLNDAFDAEIDRQQRANRPIPQGEISARTVFAVGFAMLALGLVLILPLGYAAVLVGLSLVVAIILYDWLHKTTVLAPLIMGATRFLSYALAAYAAAQVFPPEALWGALGLFAYVIGLTYAAKQEAFDRLERAWPLGVLAIPCAIALWSATQNALALPVALAFLAVVVMALRGLFRRGAGDVPRAVVLMIAGIALYDAALMAGKGAVLPAGLAIAAFVLTRWFQRIVPGT
ncbi:MAG: UbiA family prenyltransferase [Pseudomonadota bacterium]